MDTLLLLTDSLVKVIPYSSSTLANTFPPCSVDWLDVLSKIGILLIGLSSLYLSYHFHSTNRDIQKEKDAKVDRRNLLNDLILKYRLGIFYEIFKDINISCRTLLNESISEDVQKDQVNTELEELFIRLNQEFTMVLNAVDPSLSQKILSISDQLQEDLSINIFDKGVNLYVLDKYQELIQSPILSTQTQILKALYDFT